MGEGLRVFSDLLNLGHKLVHNQAKDHSAHRVDSQQANVRDFKCNQATIVSKILERVYDDNGQIGSDMHCDHFLVNHSLAQ
jgi:hypothetical protein